MEFLEMLAYESGESNSGWYKWIDQVEEALGHSMDGDQDTEGYSMDGAHDRWKLGDTVDQHVGSVKEAKAALVGRQAN